MNELPIAEEFHSIQGEGAWVGTPMHFIRLAGCNVGRPIEGGEIFLCQAFNGRHFECDTDFRMKDRYSIEQAIADTWETSLCVTGGEPFQPAYAHLIQHLLSAAIAVGKNLHFETNGTQPIPEMPGWITLSPKKGYLPENIERADEIKLLVDYDTLYADLTPFEEHPLVFVSPINHHDELIKHNLLPALEVLRKHPRWRLSVQLHKYLSLR